MCGISGIISSSSLLEKKIKIMINILRHRGPDFKSVYIHNNLALGHNRLSIVDLSEKSNQPMLDENKKYAITFNGEIYNFKSLKKKLLNDGISFFSNGDTEVLLKGYSLYGNKIFDLIVGFYAVCIYNIDKKKIILARDYFGKKPLYYSNTNNEFVFSSEIKAIKSVINKIPDINNDSLSHYLWKGYYANGNTAYKNIISLKPGEIIEVDLSDQRITQIYLPSVKKFTINRKYEIRDQKKIYENINESVKIRMEADVPISFLSSGGIDSSIVSYLASKNCETNIDTHYIGYSNKEDHFKNLAALLSKKINSNHFFHKMKMPKLEKAIEETINIFDEPFADYSSLPSFRIYNNISKLTKVVLTGDGADEVFNGYQDYKLFMLKNLLKGFNFKNKNIINFIYALLNNNSLFPKRLGFLLALTFVNESSLSLLTYKGGWTHYHRKKYMNDYGYKYTNEYNNEIFEKNSFMDSGENIFERYINYDLKKLAYDFLVKVDRTSMANSIEVRSPFLDKNMFDSLNNFHPNSFFKFKNNKAELKNILNYLNLNEFTHLKKKGFTPPLESMMTNQESINYLRKIISKKSILAEIFDISKLRNMISSLQKIQENKSRLWILMLYERWHRLNY